MTKLSRSLIAMAFLLGAGAPTLWANGIAVTNVSLVNVGGGLAEVAFDVSWSNGWNLTWSEDGGSTQVTNHDAAWVFVKFRVGPGEWRQAWLAPTGHTATGGTRIDVASDGGATNLGAWVYLAESGAGSVNGPGMRLRWDYTKNGLTGTNSVDISVHAIEMVYVPQAAFYLGSGGTEESRFYEYPNDRVPYRVTNECEIAIGSVTGRLYYEKGWDGNGANRGGDQAGPIPAAYPKGFSAFYCMKYEVTQGQYAEFLNGADGHAATYWPNSYGSSRHTVKMTNGVYRADAPDRACNFLVWADLAAYLDWAALRPMTEFEYEKVCRGPLATVPDEYPWGSTSISELTGFSGTDGSGSETAMPTNANCHRAGLAGPVRVGIFATDTSSRITAGAGYYGAMELGGNVVEMMVSAGHAPGRSFTGTPGDGLLSARPATWPVFNSGGIQMRGGSWSSSEVKFLRTSCRLDVYNGTSPILARQSFGGGRGVRGAP